MTCKGLDSNPLFSGGSVRIRDLPLSIDSRLKFIVWDFKKFKILTWIQNHVNRKCSLESRLELLCLESVRSSRKVQTYSQASPESDILTVDLDSSPLVQIL